VEEIGMRYSQIAELEIDPAQLESYKAAVKEQIETANSVRDRKDLHACNMTRGDIQ
jgi:hypothetical protein